MASGIPMPQLLFTARDVKITPRHMRLGAEFFGAFCIAGGGSTNTGRAVAAQFPAVLAYLENGLAEETGHVQEIAPDMATWPAALLNFLQVYYDEYKDLVETDTNVRILAKRFASDQLQEVILPAFYSEKRYQLYVVEAGLHRQFMPYPEGDRAKPDEWDAAKISTNVTSKQLRDRPEYVSRITSRPYVSTTSDAYRFGTRGAPRTPGWPDLVSS